MITSIEMFELNKKYYFNDLTEILGVSKEGEHIEDYGVHGRLQELRSKSENSVLKVLTNIARFHNKKCFSARRWKGENPYFYFMFVDSYDIINDIYQVESKCERDNGLVDLECVFVTPGNQEYNRENEETADPDEEESEFKPYFCKEGENVEYENTEICVEYYTGDKY